MIEGDYLTLSDIYLIWIGATAVSLIVGTIFLPWYSIPEDPNCSKSTQFLTLVDVLRHKKSIIQQSEDALKSKFLANMKYLKSPMLFATFYNFAVGNFIVHTSIALMNDVLR